MKASIGKVCDAEYYTRDVAEDRHDYYAGHGEAAGRWAGTHAAKLGLDGEVHAAAFAEVLANHHPDTGERLKPHDNLKNLAYDVTFSPAKTVSVLWALADPATRADVVQACEAGHAAGLAYLEQSACVARLGRQGADAAPATGFAAAVFRHRFSREGDPQLHWHTVLANVAETADGRAAALDGALLYAHAPTAAAIAERVMRTQLAADGIEFERRRGRWEVAAVPPALARLFSKRRARIEAAVAERGGDTGDGRALQAAALATRAAKQTAASDVHTRWHTEAQAAGHHPDLPTLTPTPQHARDPLAEPELVGDAARPAPLQGRRVTAGHGRSVAAQPAAAEGSGPPAAEPGSASPGREEGVQRVVEDLLGPEGLTERASSFGRRDVLRALADQLPVVGGTKEETVAALEAAADRLLADRRVIPLLQPTVTTGEVIRPRDDSGRVLAAVRTQAERRYSTADLLAAEHELLTRAQTRASAGAPVVPAHLVDAAIAQGERELDADQEAMVRAVTRSGAGVDVVVGKAGVGKTTAIDRAAAAFTLAGHPVLGVAPSATAAKQLAEATGMAASTVDRLLVQLDAGATRLPPGAVVILDEAAMCSTRRRLALQRAVDAVGGKVIDVGDDRQIPSVDVGGAFHALGATLGASTLGVNHRFRDPAYRTAADLLWDGHHDQAIAVLEAAGAVYEHKHADVVHRRMIQDWADLRAQGADARLFATTHTTVDRLNDLARAHLQASGALPQRGRGYASPEGHRGIDLVVGDRIRLGANDYRLPQPGGGTVAVTNGTEATVARLTRAAVTVSLDAGDAAGGPATIALPAAYVGEHVHHGYARTAHSAQGSTIDHGLFAPTGYGALELGYVALTRGALTNRVYAVEGNGWRDQLANRAAHTPALHQHPHPDLWSHRTPDRIGPAVAPSDAGATSARPVDAASATHRADALAALRRVPPPAEPPEPSEGLDHGAGERGGPPADGSGARPAPDRDWLVPLPDPPVDDDGEDRAVQRAAVVAAAERDLPSIAM